mmetsp:Transcript_28380/g.51732  ORF Transcript_28380/g.51732 Transcript_28380/m.51732 type:complete len:379 (-) Transcript_28380:120-1256(-)
MRGIIRWKRLFFVMAIMLCLGEVYGSQIMVRDPAFQSTNWRQRRGMIRQPEQTDSKSAISNVPSIPFFAAKDGVLLACGTKTMPHNYRKWRTSKLCLTAAGTTPAGMDGSDETEEGMNADVSIEYCTGCRWNLRSAWLMQELLTTFEEESNLHSVTMIPIRPPAPGGIFRVTVNDSITLWDRKIEGRFPEAKEVKRLVRDIVAPTRDLGHSDVAKTSGSDTSTASDDDCIECQEDTNIIDMNNAAIDTISDDPTIGNKSPHVCITYCTGCRWMLRASWYAQELLSTFSEDINSITLVPSRPPAPGGQFMVTLDGVELWDRATEDRFPEAKELKQRIRDVISPSRDLGHSDTTKMSIQDEDDGMNDDDAEAMRLFYGVN